MFYVILDSNILINNWFLDQPNFSKLVELAHFAPLSIILPETVIDEIKTRYNEGFTRHRERVESALKDMQHYLRDELGIGARIQYTGLQSVDVTAEYGNFLLHKIKHLKNFLILPYPKIRSKDIITRALMQRTPFRASKSGQTGFRDYIIWTSIMDLLRASEMGTFIYITANKEDYYDKELGALDADIQQDLAGINMTNKEFYIFDSLHGFYDQYEDILIRFVGETIQKENYPALLEAAEHEINNSDAFRHQLKDLFRSSHEDWLPEIEPRHLDLSYSHIIRRPIRVMAMHDIYALQPNKVMSFDFTHYYIRGRYKVKVDLRYNVDKTDYWKARRYDPSIPEPIVTPGRENYVLDQTMHIVVEVDLRYNRSEQTFDSVEAKISADHSLTAAVATGSAMHKHDEKDSGGSMTMAHRAAQRKADEYEFDGDVDVNKIRPRH